MRRDPLDPLSHPRLTLLGWFGAALFLAAGFAWLTQLYSIFFCTFAKGTVTETRRVFAGKGRYNYLMAIGTATVRIPAKVYDAIQQGDQIERTPGSFFLRVNGRRIFLLSWGTLFFLGLAVGCIALGLTTPPAASHIAEGFLPDEQFQGLLFVIAFLFLYFGFDLY
jgi:hypothetical protein